MHILNYVENSYTFVKFIIELVALAVKSGLTVSFKTIFSANVLGFAAALYARLELETQFVKKKFIF